MALKQFPNLVGDLPIEFLLSLFDLKKQTLILEDIYSCVLGGIVPA
jgi:hypothetical protein